ncbi:MAG: hypothetical protein FWH27_16835 [Planctomycetaceae bacterium]|nr:hypothetical protein [Planctomycetaceae bacterium]
MEFKSIKPSTVITDKTFKNIVSDSLNNGGQAPTIVIDARGKGLSQADAIIGMENAMKFNSKRLGYLAVIGDGYFIGIFSPFF